MSILHSPLAQRQKWRKKMLNTFFFMMFSYKTKINDSDVLVRVFEWPSHPGTCWEPTVPPWGLQVESSPAPCWERTDPPWGLQVDSSPAPCWDRTDTPLGLQFESSPAPCWDRRGPSSLSWTGLALDQTGSYWTPTGLGWNLHVFLLNRLYTVQYTNY